MNKKQIGSMIVLTNSLLRSKGKQNSLHLPEELLEKLLLVDTTIDNGDIHSTIAVFKVLNHINLGNDVHGLTDLLKEYGSKDFSKLTERVISYPEISKFYVGCLTGGNWPAVCAQFIQLHPTALWED